MKNHPLLGKRVTVRQVRGIVRRTERTRRVLNALGLGRVGKKQDFTLNEPLIGMLARVKHLVELHEA